MVTVIIVFVLVSVVVAAVAYLILTQSDDWRL